MAAYQTVEIMVDGNRSQVDRTAGFVINPLLAGKGLAAFALIMIRSELGNGSSGGSTGYAAQGTEVTTPCLAWERRARIAEPPTIERTR